MFLATHGILAKSTAVSSLLLDTYSGAAAAYSLRKLRTAYSGSAIRVRRSSDNAEQDFGFVSNVLDTASLLTFCGAGNGFVTTWYDQSGNARNKTQTTAANQPQLVSSGSVINVNSKPSIQLDGTNDFMQVASSTATFNALHNGTNSAIFSTVKFGNSSNPNAGYVLLDNGGIASASIGISLFYDDRAVVPRNNVIINYISRGVQDFFTSLNVSADNAITPNVQNLVSVLLDGDNATASQRSKIKINANNDITNNTLTNAPSASNATYNLTMGRTDVGGGILYMSGNVQEIIIYGSDQSSNQSGINSNINTFYTIY